MRWQRPLRIVLALVGIACAAALVVYSRRSHRAVASPAPPIVDPKATSAGTGVRNIRFKGPQEELQIQSERQIKYEDGRMRLEVVHMTTTRQGRVFDIWADTAESQGEAVTGDQPGQVTLTGHVRTKASDGLELFTDLATYDDSQGLATIPGKVTFTRDRLKGEGVGATYDRIRNVIWLHDQAHVVRGADKDGGGALDATAKAIGIARNDKIMTMNEHAKLVHSNQTFVADNLVVYFTEDEKGAKLVEMRGNSSVLPPADAKSGSPEMHGDNINLEMQPDGQTLKHGVLTGNARLIQLDDQRNKQTISAPAIDLVTGPDGRTLTNLTAKTGVDVALPPTADAPGRNIKAPSLIASGNEKEGLKTALFEGGVDFHESQPAARGKPAIDRTGKSATLALDLNGQLGAIDRAEFRQNVTFKDGDIAGRAEVGVYNEKSGTLELTSPKQGTKTPLVDDATIHVEALYISVTLDSHDLRAKDNVFAKMIQSNTDSKAHPPALFDDKQPVFGTSAALKYVGSTQAATFVSGPPVPARVFQDDGSQVAAERIDLDQDSGNLEANGNVSSRFFLDAADDDTKPAGPPKKPAPTLASGKQMKYIDANRKATYFGEASALAKFTGSEGTVEGQQIDVTLAQEQRSVQRLEANKDVYAKFEAGREAIGPHLTYEASTEIYEITGGPGQPVFFKNVDSKGGRCNLETSTVVIYDRRTESVTEPRSASGAIRASKPVACETPLKTLIAPPKAVK
jgi:lipopolysaccharide export system protein LptA